MLERFDALLYFFVIAAGVACCAMGLGLLLMAWVKPSLREMYVFGKRVFSQRLPLDRIRVTWLASFLACWGAYLILDATATGSRTFRLILLAAATASMFAMFMGQRASKL